MRITEAARRLGLSPRMLRYREALGLLPPSRVRAPGHRKYGEDELRAAELALELEQRFGVGPAELAFGLRVLAEPGVAARLRELGERTGRLKPPSTRALDFEKERALRWLGTPVEPPRPRVRSRPPERPGH
jgi:DNA-binding transcriptional MerR regulator